MRVFIFYGTMTILSIASQFSEFLNSDASNETCFAYSRCNATVYATKRCGPSRHRPAAASGRRR
jgi:hypothetical protein